MNIEPWRPFFKVVGLLLLFGGTGVSVLNLLLSVGNPPRDIPTSSLLEHLVIAITMGAAAIVGGVMVAGWYVAESRSVNTATVPTQAYSSTSSAPVRTPTVAVKAPPAAPPGFGFPMRDAMMYLAADTAATQTSRPVYEKQLSQFCKLQTYPENVIQWAWSNNVEPADFAEFVRYIEAYRDFIRVGATA